MNSIFCKSLKDARRSKGFTQKEVAGFLNVVESCYANWEQGRTEPNTSDLQKLCLIFDVPADYLLGLEREDGTSVGVMLDLPKIRSNEEKELFCVFEKLSRTNRMKLLCYSQGLLEAQLA